MKISCSLSVIKNLSAGKVREILNSDRAGDYLLLDVRQPEEYAKSHLPGAKLTPLGELENRLGELDSSHKLIIYCRSGRRSTAAAVSLCETGFQETYNLDGGILAWNGETLSDFPEPVTSFSIEASGIAELLGIALKMEIGTSYFYHEIARVSAIPKLLEVFNKLALLEDCHVQKIYQRLALVDSKVRPLSEFMAAPEKILEGGSHLDSGLLRENQPVDEITAVESAVKREYLAYDFYRRAALEVKGDDVYQLLNQLAIEEREHARTTTGLLSVIFKT